MPSPQLIVEVVLSGQENQIRDYRHKRSEYAARRIPEYWIIDPIAQLITILVWVDGLYEATEFRGQERLVSPSFSSLQLSANQILQPA